MRKVLDKVVAFVKANQTAVLIGTVVVVVLIVVI